MLYICGTRPVIHKLSASHPIRSSAEQTTFTLSIRCPLWDIALSFQRIHVEVKNVQPQMQKNVNYGEPVSKPS